MLAGSDSTLTHSGSLPGDFLDHSSVEPSPLLTQFIWNFSAADDTLDLALSIQSMNYSLEGRWSFSYPTGVLHSKSLFPLLLLNSAREMRRIFKTEEKILLWTPPELPLTTHLLECLLLPGAHDVVPLPSVNH